MKMIKQSVPVLGVDVREAIRRLIETCRTKKKARRKIHGIILKADRKSTWHSLVRDFNFQVYERARAGRNLPEERKMSHNKVKRCKKFRKSCPLTQLSRTHH